MKNFFAEVKEYFGFNSRERSAVLVLSVLILALLFINLFPGYFVKVADANFTSFDSLVMVINQSRREVSSKPVYDVLGNPDPDKAFLTAKSTINNPPSGNMMLAEANSRISNKFLFPI